MAVDDEVRTESSSSSSLIRDSQQSDEKKDVLSPEDLAWVDSCLIKESEISSGDWDSMKDALLEVLSSQPGSNSSESLENDIEMLASEVDAEANQGFQEEAKGFRRTLQDTFTKKEADSDSNKFPEKDVDDLHLVAFAGNPFLPSFVDGLKKSETTESETGSSSSVDGIEQSTKDIFRVWDLNIPAEENELDQQLNKILEERGLQSESEPSVIDDSTAGKDLERESLDDVIAAMSGISLK